MRGPIFASLLVVLALLTGCGPRGNPDEGVSVGKRLPNAEFTTFGGGRTSLEELRGKPAVVNFWATWCAPCREEIPVLEAAHAQTNGDVHFLAITNELPHEVRPFMADVNMTLPVFFDPGQRAGKRYQVQSIPTTFFLDQEGFIVARHNGALSEARLAAYLERITDTAPAEEQPAPTRPSVPAPAPTLPVLPNTGDDSVGWRRPGLL